MRIVGMRGQPLTDPVAAIAEAPDGADLVAATVVLNHALANAFDVGGVIVEIADQRPHSSQGVIENRAVVGGCHVLLPIMIAIIELPTRETHPISERADIRGGTSPRARG